MKPQTDPLLPTPYSLPPFNIVLTGFMGTGKTSVGREAARRLGRPFVDMDVEIEKRAGKAISRIFAEDGEAKFRGIEADLCAKLSHRDGLVIATGGGALIDPDNRRRMMACGPVFCLTTGADTLLARLAAAQDRPLLDVADRKAEIERLLAGRQDAYAAIPRQIDTTHLSVDEIVARVVEQAFSILLPVRHPGGSYPIHIGSGLLNKLGELVRPISKTGAVAVVTNPTVGALYRDRVLDTLRAAGLSPFFCTMPDGEQYKTLGTLASLYDQMIDGGLDRGGAVLALGGGVVCDVTGFAAATFMRGLPVIQAPTTLLAMVDASVGGKTAVDLPQGKNLVGAFKQPSLVAIDPDVLSTLPAGEVASGMAELIKHGVLADVELFEELASARMETCPTKNATTFNGRAAFHSRHLPPWSRWIARSLQVKIDVVEQDPFERGLRAVLNLGHTTAHAL
ncbi:MAG: bifunctional shikimate kinase/3-dehydroquinate synthase, partial [Anaerolineae bacterium]|nr:bifunctional shikimate kinase/3-dehydroquinate synthase [Anaerolineae bacterium]